MITLKRLSAVATALPFTLHCAGICWAQETPQDSESLETIEVHGHFLAEGSTSAMKLNVPVRDTPFSVSNYTDTFMKAIDASNVSDLYNYMTGVKRAGNTGYDMTIRGFRTTNDDKNAIMVDGLPGLTGRFGSPSVAGVSHIELVKGPASVLYGQAQPGGFVNLITKTPSPTRSLTAYVQGTSYDGDKLQFERGGGDANIDATGPIDSQNRFVYRLIAEYTNRRLFRDFTYDKGDYVAPMLQWNISDRTYALLQLEQRDDRNAFDAGLVAPHNDIHLVAPITTYYAEPEYGDFKKEMGQTLSIRVRHAFANGAVWNFGERSVYNRSLDWEYNSISTIVVRGVDELQRRAVHKLNTRHFHYADTNLNIPFDTALLHHNALVGVNGGVDTSDENRLQHYNSGPCPGPLCLAIPVQNPVYGLVPPESTLPAVIASQAQANLLHNLFEAHSYGLYASDLITLSTQWKLSVGIRKTYERQRIQEIRFTGPVTIKTTDKWLPTAGLLYQPTKYLTLYTSYSTSYVPAPANSQDVNGRNPFAPIGGKQYEAGVKTAGFFQDRLNATLAVYRIDRTNTLNTFNCPNGVLATGTCTAQTGNERSDGAELEINARPIDNLQFTFGYAYTNARVTDSMTAQVIGARLPNVAKNAANLWARYDIPAGPLAGLGFGVGIIYTGERAGLLPTATSNDLLLMPGYTVVDLGIYYVRDRYALNFKAGNLLDRTYYEDAGSAAAVQILPGAPRNLSLSATVRF